ncbi:PHD finger protein [Forsythia ovata]|uniref:PHD finger protein n=1 Tax=Forsythia ovata TaxID=205694 RepID=A0ABD1U6K5_9LAMI
MGRVPCRDRGIRVELPFLCMVRPETVVRHLPSTKRDLAVSAASTLCDCKQFVKDFHPENNFSASESKAIQLFCEVDLVEQSEEYIPNPPPELLVLSPDATIADLKLEAMKAFQEVYLIFRRFQAEELMGYGGVDESTQVKLLLGSTEFVRIRDKFIGKNGLSRYRMERGTERWTVDCF